MTDSKLILYRQEILNFVRSMTIKYTPLIEQINTNLVAAGYAVDVDHPETWKYYLNVVGQYHVADTKMYVVSADTQETILFSPETLATHVRTRRYYQPGQDGYIALCAKYPNQTDLIRSILFPVDDIHRAIQAEEFTLLAYGDGFLEPEEQPSIVTLINDYLTFVFERWYFDFLNYEVGFNWTFWGNFWYNVVLYIYACRVRLLHTAYVHSFHIWSFLESNGLGDYSDILNRRQALYLYRNISYLNSNRGKEDTLILLVDNLLKELNIGIVGKTLYMRTDLGRDRCRWTPAFISEKVPTVHADAIPVIPPETTNDIEHRLYEIDADDNVDGDYITEVERRLGCTTFNRLQSKLVEIRPVELNRYYSDVLTTYLTDSVIYTITQGLYVPHIDIVDPVSTIKFTLSGSEALALAYYATHKATGYTPLELPTVYSPHAVYKKNIASVQFPETYRFDYHTYVTKAFVDPAEFIAGVGYPLAPITDPDAFSHVMGRNFSVLVRQLTESRSASSVVHSAIIADIFNRVTVSTPQAISLASERTYPEWLSHDHHNLQWLVDQYDSQTESRTLYGTLADLIWQTLMPVTDPILVSYINTPYSEVFYRRLKELFIQLCSYNILFLDTSRLSHQWMFLDKMGLDPIYPAIMDKRNISADLDINLKSLVTDVQTVIIPPELIAPSLTCADTLSIACPISYKMRDHLTSSTNIAVDEDVNPIQESSKTVVRCHTDLVIHVT